MRRSLLTRPVASGGGGWSYSAVVFELLGPNIYGSDTYSLDSGYAYVFMPSLRRTGTAIGTEYTASGGSFYAYAVAKGTSGVISFGTGGQGILVAKFTTTSAVAPPLSAVTGRSHASTFTAGATGLTLDVAFTNNLSSDPPVFTYPSGETGINQLAAAYEDSGFFFCYAVGAACTATPSTAVGAWSATNGPSDNGRVTLTVG